MSPEIKKLLNAIQAQVTPEALAKTKDVLDGSCPGEVLLIATAFRELAEYAEETSHEEIAVGFFGRAEEAQQRAENYRLCYRAVVFQFGGDTAAWAAQFTPTSGGT